MRNGRFVAPDGPQLKHLADALGAVPVLRPETVRAE